MVFLRFPYNFMELVYSGVIEIYVPLGLAVRFMQANFTQI